MTMVNKITELTGMCAAQAQSKDELDPNLILISEEAYYILIAELRRMDLFHNGSSHWLMEFRGMRIVRGLEMGFNVGVFYKRPDGQMRGNVI